MLGVVIEEHVAQLEQRQHALVCDEVEDRPVLPPGGDETAPAQAGEMVRHARLLDADPLRDLADRELVLGAQ